MNPATPEPEAVCELGTCGEPAVGVMWFYRPACLHNGAPASLWVCEPMRRALLACPEAPKPSVCVHCGEVSRVNAFPLHYADQRTPLTEPLCSLVDGPDDRPLRVTSGQRDRVTCQSCLELLHS